MCSNNINCLEIETNGRHFNTVTRIVLITMTFTIGLSILGAWDVAQNGFQQDDIELPFIPENKFPEESSSVIKNSDDLSLELKKDKEATLCGSSDVSVPEYGLFEDFDTEVGEMEIADQVLPTGDLPLCIDNEYLDDFYIVVGTYGGYQWVSGCIKVMQSKSDKPMWDNIVGYIDVDAIPIDIAEGKHGWVYYNLTFTVSGNHPIILESNHIPDSPLGDFYVSGPSDLDKFVDLKIKTTWEGCHQETQQFMVILAHKVMSQNKIPNSR